MLIMILRKLRHYTKIIFIFDGNFFKNVLVVELIKNENPLYQKNMINYSQIQIVVLPQLNPVYIPGKKPIVLFYFFVYILPFLYIRYSMYFVRLKLFFLGAYYLYCNFRSLVYDFPTKKKWQKIVQIDKLDQLSDVDGILRSRLV